MCLEVAAIRRPLLATARATTDAAEPWTPSQVRTKGLRVGIATLLFSPPLSARSRCVESFRGCGLLPWCTAARHMIAALKENGFLGSVELLAITDQGRSNSSTAAVCPGDRLILEDCPGLRLIRPTRGLLQAAQQHIHRVLKGGVMSYGPEYVRPRIGVFWKWELLRLGKDYDAVLFTDMDVDLAKRPSLDGAHYMKHMRDTARQWMQSLPRLVARSKVEPRPLRMLCYGDVTSPFIAAVFWIFPPLGEHLYRDGLHVLRAPWNYSHGWNLSGTPKELFASAPGLNIAQSGWDDIDSGDLEQGWMLYMLFHRHQAGALMTRKGAHVRHYVWGSSEKPWTRVLNWLHRGPNKKPCDKHVLLFRAYVLELLPLDGATTGSVCAADFARAKLALSSPQLNATACCDTIPHHVNGAGMAGASLDNLFRAIQVPLF